MEKLPAGQDSEVKVARTSLLASDADPTEPETYYHRGFLEAF